LIFIELEEKPEDFVIGIATMETLTRINFFEKLCRKITEYFDEELWIYIVEEVKTNK
jgi:hypothetical protein